MHFAIKTEKPKQIGETLRASGSNSDRYQERHFGGETNCFPNDSRAINSLPSQHEAFMVRHDAKSTQSLSRRFGESWNSADLEGNEQI